VDSSAPSARGRPVPGNPMTPTRRSVWFLLLAVGACLAWTRWSAPVRAQERAPNRREFTITAKDFRFTPDRIEVIQDDLIKLTLTSADVAYGFSIDKLRVSKRIPAGMSVTFDLRADQSGTFEFYSNLTSDPRHASMRGQLVVKPK
jgi:heme/copper-type cytochrome/quinol oxidase subunit 2